MSTSDVVVVGGGIEGAAPAYGLAQNGLGVTVLEASKEFPDRVRGESMHLWGLVEARRSGAKDALLAAGAHVAPLWMQHVEGVGATAGRRRSAASPASSFTARSRSTTSRACSWTSPKACPLTTTCSGPGL